MKEELSKMHILAPHPFFGLRPWRRHSLVLLISGLVYIAIGLSYILTDPSPARQVSLSLALFWAPIEFWGGAFIFSGMMAIISSRWPPISKTWGYMVLTGLSTGWSMFYLVGIWFFHAPKQNINGVLSWGLVGFLWWAISGLRNPGEPEEKYVAGLVPEKEAESIRIELSSNLNGDKEV